jgi:hypothetical protein
VLVGVRLVPVEAKVGAFSSGKLWTREIRPAQISWHYRLLRDGGYSVFAFGVLDASLWRTFIFKITVENFHVLMGWRDGIELKHLHAWNPDLTPPSRQLLK